MREQQFATITEWQKETFRQATSGSKIAHMAQELSELYAEIHHGNASERAEQRRLEFADCFILLFGAAASDGMSYEDICAAIEDKMTINYKRKWGKPDENGVVNHVREEV